MNDHDSVGARTGQAGLAGGSVAVRLPAQDLERARRFYSDVLGLDPVEERPGGLLYKPDGGGEFALFGSAGGPPGGHTQMGFEVADIEATVRGLRERGLELMEVEMPGVEVVDGIADIPGNYASKGGKGERAVWLTDSEGNVIGVSERMR